MTSTKKNMTKKQPPMNKSKSSMVRSFLIALSMLVFPFESPSSIRITIDTPNLPIISEGSQKVISISIDNSLLTTLRFDSEIAIDSTQIFSLGTMSVKTESNCDIKLSITHENVSYHVALTRNLLAFSDSIKVNFCSTKVRKRNASIATFTARSGPMTVTGYCIATRE